MKPKLILCFALVLSCSWLGCSTVVNRSVAAVAPEQNDTDALSILHVGMTIGDADQDLRRSGGMRAFTVSSAVRHRYYYFFIPDMNGVTLQFDEHDKLMSWQPFKVAAVSEVKLKFVKVDSEETNGQDGYGANAVDGNPNTFWHTQWHDGSPGLPHEIIIELLPPSVIKGFTYLPRQDELDHGTIKDYEFYVSNDGENFGQPVKKGTFEPGKEEKSETFEPVKCRFIKLKALSEINGLPWTSAAEVRVIQSGEDASVTDYWRGNIGQTDWDASARHDSAKPDAIDLFVAALSTDGWMWKNGADAIRVTQATTPEEVVSETLRMAKFEAGLVTSYQILNKREVHIPDTCTAVLVATNLGRMIVLMQYSEGKDATPGHWWRRIYDASLPVKRLY